MEDDRSEEKQATENVAPPPVVEPPAQQAPNLQTLPDILNWIFIGRNGFRTGWSLLAFFGIMGLSLISIDGIALATHLKPETNLSSPIPTILVEALSLLMVAVPTAAMALIERRSPLSYGFKDRKALPRLASGFLVGFAAISVLIGLLWGFQLLSFDRLSLHGVAVLRNGALFEEALSRGYAQYTLTRGLNFWWAALITSLAFGVIHLGNPGENWVGIVDVIGAGFVFVLSLRLTGSLFWAVGMHAGWDWAQSFFYGVADSGTIAQGHLLTSHPTGNRFWNGAAAGPEGSPLALLVELMLVGTLLMAAKARRAPFIGTVK